MKPVTDVNFIAATSGEFWSAPCDVGEVVDDVLGVWVDSVGGQPPRDIESDSDVSDAVSWLNNPKQRLGDIIERLDKRIAELEAVLGELVTMFNPEPKETETVWDRAAAVLRKSPNT